MLYSLMDIACCIVWNTVNQLTPAKLLRRTVHRIPSYMEIDNLLTFFKQQTKNYLPSSSMPLRYIQITFNSSNYSDLNARYVLCIITHHKACCLRCALYCRPASRWRRIWALCLAVSSLQGYGKANNISNKHRVTGIRRLHNSRGCMQWNQTYYAVLMKT